MASLQPVAAGFSVTPTREREREYLRFLLRRNERAVPLDDALFEIRTAGDGLHVVLLPFRSYEAARRVLKAFERASKAHQKAERRREKIRPMGG